ncbi:TPA: solute carrier family 23 protein [Escherichia coli]
MNNDNTDYVSNESGTLSRLFKLPQHGTTVRTELIAGMTTFLTMVYIVFVNPQILGAAQMDPKVVFVTTCLIAGIGSIAMGIFANLPVALAPAMGLNAFFAFVVVGAMGISWQTGMGAIFWGAVGLFLLTLFRIRYWMISNIPLSLRIGITSGIGLFIALMGLKNTGVIVANKDTLVMIGDLSSHGVLLGILGFFIITVLSSRHFHAAVLVSIVVTSCCGLFFGDVHFSGVYSIPPDISGVIGEVDLSGALTLELAGIIFSFMLINLFDSSGTLIGVTDKAGLIDGNGKFPNMNKALYVDSVSSVAGAFIGTSSVTAYIESTSGVAVGGRTGLTAVVVGVMFLLVMFFSPLVAMVPPYATAGQFAFFTYIRPVYMNLAGFGVDGLTLVLLSFGIASFIGTSLSSFILKRSVKLALAGAPLILAVSALVLTLWGSDKIVATGVAIIWGLTFALVPVGWSTWITRSLADQAEKAGSIQVAVIQLANTCGAAIGGYALDNIGLTSPLMLSGTLMLLTALLVTAKVKMKKS